MSPVATIRLVATIVAVVVASVSAADTKLHGLRLPPPLRSAAVAAVCGKHFPCRAALDAFPTHSPTTPPLMSKEVSKALQLYSYSSAETRILQHCRKPDTDFVVCCLMAFDLQADVDGLPDLARFLVSFYKQYQRKTPTQCEDAYCWLKKLVGGALWYLLILFFMVLIPFSFIKGCGF